MCFSAAASITAGVALSAVGTSMVAKANRKERALASIPLLFGVQQLIDGVVWLSFGAPLIHTSAVYGYAFFAFVFWPVFVPLALLPIETDKHRRDILGALGLVGLGVGLFFLYYIVTGSVSAEIVHRCVAYHTPHPYGFESLAFYVVVTCGSFFMSSKKILNAFGLFLLLAFGVAGWFYVETFSSVWCFFAAVLSAILYWYFSRKN